MQQNQEQVTTMKDVFKNKKVIVIVIFTFAVMFSITIGIFVYNYGIKGIGDASITDDASATNSANFKDDTENVNDTGIPLGGFYEKNRIEETTREIPLKLVRQFEMDDETLEGLVDNWEFIESSGYIEFSELVYEYYDIMPVEELCERFAIDFETEKGGEVIISHGRKIAQFIYDTNWRFYHWQDGWWSIAVPRFERDFSPKTIYVYTSDFPLHELHPLDLHSYLKRDKRYVDDEQVWDVQMWSEDNPSPRLVLD
jgi:hypothetical protein